MMKKLFFLLFGLIISLSSLELNAQRIRLIDGDPGVLQGIHRLNIQYDYSQMAVGNYADERDYINKKREELNAKKDGRGDQWVKDWVSDRQTLFQPMFEDLFSKYSGLVVGNLPSERYTLIIKTTFTEPGYNVYVSHRMAFINGEALIVETANPEHIIAKFTIYHSPGRDALGFDYATGTRIKEAYAAAGKAFGRALNKYL